jgi:hypothetical protein
MVLGCAALLAGSKLSHGSGDAGASASASAAGSNAASAAAPASAPGASIAAAPADGKHRYEVKSGIVEMSNSMMENMLETLYFDDYGGKQATVTSMDMKVLGQTIHSEHVNIDAGGYHVTYDPRKKTGTRHKLVPGAPPVPTERRDRIGPPQAERGVQADAGDDGGGEPGACQGLLRIGDERAAADRPADPKFRAPEQGHRHECHRGHRA